MKYEDHCKQWQCQCSSRKRRRKLWWEIEVGTYYLWVDDGGLEHCVLCTVRNDGRNAGELWAKWWENGGRARERRRTGDVREKYRMRMDGEDVER